MTTDSSSPDEQAPYRRWLNQSADLDDHEWEGSIFDPTRIRYFSILPDEDAKEAYCIRHDHPMRCVDPGIKHMGAFYTTTEGFSVYTCRSCTAEIDRQAGHPQAGLAAYQHALMGAFDAWDSGDALGDWFRFLSEEQPEGVGSAD